MGRKPSAIVLVLWLSFILAITDVLLVVPLITSFVHHWSIPFHLGIWAVTFYIVAYGFALPATEYVSERVGRQFLLAISLLQFGLGALVSGFSTGIGLLLVGRVLQGLAAGFLVWLSYPTVFRRKFSSIRDWKWVVFLFLVIIVPVVSSLGVQIFSWRLSFYIQAGFASVSFFFVLRAPNRQHVNVRSLDLPGIALLSIMTICLIVGMGNRLLPLIVTSLGLIVPFTMIERLQKRPLIPETLFHEEYIVPRLLIHFFVGMSSAGIIFIPGFTEVSLNLDLGKGAYFLMYFGVILIAYLLFSTVYSVRHYDISVTAVGLFLSACGFLMLATFAERTWHMVLALTCLGIGTGIVIRVLIERREISKKSRHDDVVCGLCRIVGMAIGVSILVTFLTLANERIPDQVRHSLIATPSSESHEITGGPLAKFVEESGGLAALDETQIKELMPSHIAPATQELIVRQIMNVVRQTLVEGYRDLFLTATVFSLLALLLTLTLYRTMTEKRD